MIPRPKRALALIALVIALPLAPRVASADPVGDFFKRVGRTLSKPLPPPSKQGTRKTNGTRAKAESSPGAASSPSPGGASAQTIPPSAAGTPGAQPASTPAQPTTEVASSAPESNARRDVPYAVPAANRPGFVTSPYAPTRGLVDVRGFASGTEVKDPYTGKIFRTP